MFPLRIQNNYLNI